MKSHQSSRTLALALSLATLAPLGCGKGKAPLANTNAPAPAGLPPLAPGEAKAAPTAPQAPGANPHAGMQMPGGPNPHAGMQMPGGPNPHAGMQMPGANPHGGAPMPGGIPAMNAAGEPTTPGGIPFDDKSVIAGTLAVPATNKDKVKAGDTIFLVVRRAEDSGAPGPILAVKRLDAKSFPQPFVVDGRDAMMAGTALSGKVQVTARIDKDGNATTKNPGDLVGTSPVLTPPAKQVVINLDKVL